MIAIGLIVAPFLNLKNLWGVSAMSLGLDWSHLASINPLGVVTIVFELLVQAFMVAASIFLLSLFFLQRRAFPKFAILYMWVLVLLSLITTGFAMLMFHAGAPGATSQVASEEAAQVIKLLLIAFVWTPYLLRSRRVKYTFVN